MNNNINIDTFPITEDMYQLKSINIINSNFLSLKKWHDIFDDFCKLNTEAGVTRFYIENATSIDTADLKTDHITSKETYEPYGSTSNDQNKPIFEISRESLKWKGFVVDEDGIHLPLECMVVVKNDNDLANLNTDLAIPGKYSNGFVRIILNATNSYIEVKNIGNNTSAFLNPRESVTILQNEGYWYKI